ncbi:hypothetical protein LI410_mgp062 (mitochondrion) [Apium graveolens]|uniref:hypothetical protein n=1 Tax=Apium graveolens TaxID=4045 RepID=UPI001D004C2D|nr:hypothetical protein LI410_mgp105 [Apium graveolens]YP_010185164.1 hypothetical protein LI410_mgp062 [Apium graveolens]QVJ97879.1 hypothetical protein [Apium graveolens]QVJ97921.1 hypothetical protein [Apium graveolens]QVJ98105.1 hypothetical protein [Apium graveolens]
MIPMIPSIRSNMYVLKCSIVTTSRIVPIHCYISFRYMRASPAFSLSKLKNALDVSKVTERLETLSLVDDDGDLVDNNRASSSSCSTSGSNRPSEGGIPSPRCSASASEIFDPFSSSCHHVFLSRYSFYSSSSLSSQLVCHRVPGMVRQFFLPYSSISSLMSYVSSEIIQNPLSTEFRKTVDLSHSFLFKVPRGLPACIDTYELLNLKKKVFMGLMFRFKPGQRQFLKNNILIPKSFEHLKHLRDSLGIEISKNSSSIRDLCTFTHKDGIKSAIDPNYYKNLIEVVTLLNGTFCRMLILTTTGVAFTVCYGYYPCTDGIVPIDLFNPIVSYDPFNNVETLAPNIRSAIISVKNDSLSAEAIKTAYYLPPLDDVNIPQEISGNVLRNVGLGIIIAVLITTGVLTITPDPVDIHQVMENM